MGFEPIPEEVERIAHEIIGAAIEVHRLLGPGLLESVYEAALCHELHLRGIGFRRQKSVSIAYKQVKLGTDLRLDLVVEGKVIVDLKAKERITDMDHAKTLTYLRLSGLRLGLKYSGRAYFKLIDRPPLTPELPSHQIVSLMGSVS